MFESSMNESVSSLSSDSDDESPDVSLMVSLKSPNFFEKLRTSLELGFVNFFDTGSSSSEEIKRALFLFLGTSSKISN